MSDERGGGGGDRSEAPIDLRSRREVIVRTFLREGVQLTEELLQENQDLREELLKLRADNARLRAHVARDDATRELLRTIEALEEEKRELVDKSESLEARSKSREGRFEEIEREMNDLANLYIASFQLHASLSVRRVVRHTKDILGQLVGAERFVIYVIDGQTVTPIGWDGFEPRATEASRMLSGTPPPIVRVGEGRIGEVCLTGVAYLRDRPGRGTLDAPVAVVPLMAEGRPVGAIAIASMLAQKEQWESVDHELFKLLGDHAGGALIAANLYAREESPTRALSGLTEALAPESRVGGD